MRKGKAAVGVSGAAALLVAFAAISMSQLALGGDNGSALAAQADQEALTSALGDKPVKHACLEPAGAKNPHCRPKSFGPTRFSGRVRALVVRPDDPNTIWAATASGGLWVTHDAGSSWSHASDVLRTLAFSSLAIDPQNPRVIYAGSGEVHTTLHLLDSTHLAVGSDAGFTLRNPRRGAGIFKTSDGGLHWNELSNTTLSPDFYFVSRIAVSPQNSNIVLAATATGLWRSTNGGTNWALATKRVTTPFGTLQVPLRGIFLDVKFHSHDPANVIAAGLDGQVFFANDGGAIFNASKLPAPPAGVPAIPTRVELAFLRSQPDVWFAVELFSKNSGEDPMVVLRSTDGGANFTIRSNPAVIPCGNNRLYSGALFVSDFGSNFFVGGTELCRSNNGGVSFTKVFGNDIHNDYHSIVRGGNDNLGNGTIFIGNDGGVFRILDPSRLTFTSPFDAAVLNLNNGLVNQQFQGAAMNPSGIIVGGAQDIGTLHRGTDGTWTELFGGPGGSDGPPTSADPTESDLFYFGKSVARLYRSTAGGGKECIAGVSGFPLLDMHDDGPQCSPRNPPGCDPLAAGTCTTLATARCLGATPMVLDPKDPSILYVGCERLWRSANVKSAASLIDWRIIKNADVSSPDEALISAMALAPSDRNVMWVGTIHTGLSLPGDLWMTTQLQATRFTLLSSWQKITDSILPPRPVSGLAVHPATTSRVYVSYSGWASAGMTTPSHNLFRGAKGVDGKFHFSDISAGLPPGPVYCVALNGSGRIAAGTEFGVRVSGNDGATWSLAGPRVPVAGTTWIDAHHLLVASYGRGVFELTP
jgi:photosystem II stability/assembly factor-like uncharacterized protein